MTQSNPLRVGLIGAGGRWGPRAHAPALKGVSEAELYAVCTAHAETVRPAADKFSVARAYGSDKELNTDEQVEAVAVAVRVVIVMFDPTCPSNPHHCLEIAADVNSWYDFGYGAS